MEQTLNLESHYDIDSDRNYIPFKTLTESFHTPIFMMIPSLGKYLFRGKQCGYLINKYKTES
jgi:hypothetical protein